MTLEKSWKSKKLRELPVQIIDGDRSAKYPKRSEFRESGVLFLNTTNIVDDRLDLDGAVFVGEEKFAEIKKGRAQRGDIFMTTRGSIGKVALFDCDHETALINAQMLILRPDPNQLDSRFLFHTFRSPLFKTSIGNFASGSAQPQIPITDLREVELLVPSLAIQRRIAGVLSAYDELIENSQRRIKILEEMARSLYREWFVLFRFPGHDKVKMAPSPLGSLPQGWEVKTVDELVRRIPVGKKYDQKTVAPTGTVPVLDQGKSGIIGYHDEGPGLEASEASPVIVFANHTCYQRLIHFSFSAIQNVLPFLPSPSIHRNIYWLHWATNGLVAFNDYKGHWPEFAAKRLIVPPASDCERFGNFAAPLARQTVKLERTIENLRHTRDLLLPRLLSGNLIS